MSGNSFLLNKRILLPLFFSFILHALVIFSCSFYIPIKLSPSVYGWFNVINKKDLIFKEKNINFPPEIDFSSDNIRKKYFSFKPSDLKYKLTGQGVEFLGYPSETKMAVRKELSDQNRKKYFYLWKKRAAFSPQVEEGVTYRIYVSSQGKVVFLYPEKLPVNSSGNLHLQEYIREATVFLNNKFFWTKVEEVVK